MTRTRSQLSMLWVSLLSMLMVFLLVQPSTMLMAIPPESCRLEIHGEASSGMETGAMIPKYGQRLRRRRSSWSRPTMEHSGCPLTISRNTSLFFSCANIMMIIYSTAKSLSIQMRVTTCLRCQSIPQVHTH